MFPVLAALGATGALGAVAGLYGARQTNSAQDARQADAQAFNAVEAEKQREFSAAQAKLQMDFQERMSNTAHQRATKDLEAAGLNRILSVTQGAASSPVGASGTSSAASSPSPLPVVNKVQQMIATASQAATLDNIQAQTDKTKAEADLTRKQTEVTEAQFIRPDDQGGWRAPQTWEARERQERAQELYHSAMLKNWQQFLTEKQRDLVVEEIKNAVSEGRRIEATTGNIQADTVLKTLRQDEERAGSKFWKAYPEFYGIREGIKAGGEIVNSAARGLSMLRPRGFGLRP